MKINFLLVCGGGASSSFVAQNMTKAGMQQGLDIEVEAIGETELEDYLDDRDMVLIGPHLKYLEDELKEVIAPYNIPYTFIDEKHYSKMDGAAVLKDALEIIEKNK